MASIGVAVAYDLENLSSEFENNRPLFFVCLGGQSGFEAGFFEKILCIPVMFFRYLR